MTTSQRISGKGKGEQRSLALAGGLLALSALQVHAATIGHSRLMSGPGQPLLITVQVNDVAPGDVDSLSVSVPQAGEWAQAGLTPPAPLDTLSASIQTGYAKGTKVIQVRSSQPFSRPIVDLLLDVSSASGKKRHQVSMLAQGGVDAVAPPVAGASAASQPGPEPVLSSLRVNKGDTLFAIARKNAVPGVSDYQLMVGLYQANPQAFIRKNLNLVKAGATLNVPDRATLTAISDREARRIFLQHAQAFDLYRQRLAATPDVAVAGQADAAAGTVQAQSAPVQQQAAGQGGDRLRLSEAAASGQAGQSSGQAGAGQVPQGASGQGATAGQASAGAASDDAVATGKALDDAQSRVSQLQQNVQDLNQAVQSQAASGGTGAAQPTSGVAGAGSQGAAASTNAVGSSASAGGADAASAAGTASGGSAAAATGAAALTGGAGSASGSSSVAAGTSAGADGTSAAAAGAGSIAAGAAASGGSTAGATGTSSGQGGNGAPASAATVQGSGVQSAQTAAATSSGSSTGGAGGTARADQRAQSVAEPVTQKAEQTVSWLQENMLVVVGALLTLVVLVLAWLLRRGGSRGTESEQAEGVITEAMIKDKLGNIDLNLDSESQDSSGGKR